MTFSRPTFNGLFKVEGFTNASSEFVVRRMDNPKVWYYAYATYIEEITFVDIVREVLDEQSN